MCDLLTDEFAPISTEHVLVDVDHETIDNMETVENATVIIPDDTGQMIDLETQSILLLPTETSNDDSDSVNSASTKDAKKDVLKNPNELPHFNFIRRSVEEGAEEGHYCDTDVVLSDSRISFNKLIVGLMFPVLKSCEEFGDENVIILPDYDAEQFEKLLSRFLGRNYMNENEDSENFVMSRDKNLIFTPTSVSVKEVKVPVNQNYLKQNSEFVNINFLSMEPLPLNESMKKDLPNKEPPIKPPESSKATSPCSSCKMEFSSRKDKSEHVCTKLFKCQVCLAPFEDQYNLVRHEVEVHGDLAKGLTVKTEFEPTPCSKCDKIIFKANDMAKHLCSGSKFKPTKCIKCNKILINKKQMISHECPEFIAELNSKQQLEEFDYDSTSCAVCRKEFPNNIRRTIIHEVEECAYLARRGHPEFKLKIFTCEKCMRYFVIKRKFKLHMERHQEEEEVGQQVFVGEDGEIEYHQESMEMGEVTHDTENIDPGHHFISLEEDKSGTENFFKAINQLKQLEEDCTQCGHCGKTLSSRRACIEHEATIHGDVSNAPNWKKCDHCPKIFINDKFRQDHMTVHSDLRQYQCHLCAKTFKTKSNLCAHMGNMHDTNETGMSKNFPCPYCNKHFRFQAQLLQHERVHTKEKPFKCAKCGKGFSVKCNLKAHEETHKSVYERPFKCDQCFHTSTTLPLLKLHMNSHTGDRPFICDLCGESYKRPSNLRRHRRVMCKYRPGAPTLSITEDIKPPKRLQLKTVIVHKSSPNIVSQMDADGTNYVEQPSAYYEVVTESADGGLEETMIVEGYVEDMEDAEMVIEEEVLEDGVVEEDGIKYETEYVTM